MLSRPGREQPPSIALDREAGAWLSWVAALRTGPLARLLEAAPDSAAELWRGAVREIAWRLLQSAARERLLDATRSRDCLSVALPGRAIAIPLDRAGAFELDLPALVEVEDPRLEDPLGILAALDRELAPADRARVRAEIVDSIVNLAQARLARLVRLALAASQPGRDDPRLRDPEHFVTDGHPWHPMNRTRLGLRRAEVVRYAGEQLATTPVSCIEIATSIAQATGTWIEEAARWFGPATPGFVRVPIHPAQRRRIRALFPELIASGKICWVPPGKASVIPCRSLLSLRTVALGPERHLKLACDVHTTSTRRLVSPMSVHNGPELTRALLDIAADDPIVAPLRLMGEPAAAGLDPDRLGGRAGVAAELGAILRQAPSPRAWVCAAIDERWPGTEALVLERAAEGYPGGPRERLSALIDDWIALLVPPALRLFARYGIALELHLQNTLIEVVDGRARGFWVRDLGGIRVHGPRLAAAGLARAPRFAPRSFILTNDLNEVRGKLEHSLIHAHLARVFAVAGRLGVDEDRCWADLRRCLGRCLNAWAEDPGADDELRARYREELGELTRPRVRAKALLRMRLVERSSDYDYTEVANALAEDPRDRVARPSN